MEKLWVWGAQSIEDAALEDDDNDPAAEALKALEDDKDDPDPAAEALRNDVEEENEALEDDDDDPAAEETEGTKAVGIVADEPELDPLSQLKEGQPVPLELDLLYEGFKEGSDAARPIGEVTDLAERLGFLPQIDHQPPVLEALPCPHKRSRSSNTKDFVAVGPMTNNTVKKARAERHIPIDVLEAVQQGHDVCVNGDACRLPGGSSSLIDLEKCAPCSECKLIGHFICLRTHRNLQLCCKCCPIVQARARRRALENIVARKALLNAIPLPPPPELLQVEKFIRPDVTLKMRTVLDEELEARGFATEAEMRKDIEDHNSKLQKVRENPNSLGIRARVALRNEDVSIKMLCHEWKRCHAKLRQAFIRDTRCCVKELCYDRKQSNFLAHMEWEETAVNIENKEEISVVNKEKVVVSDEWVKANFTQGTYTYLKMVSQMAVGKFLPVRPHADIFMDTRQVSHYKWSQNTNSLDSQVRKL